MGTENALELIRLGRLGVSDNAPYEVMHQEGTYKLRRYLDELGGDAPRPALLLVPPLMLTAEIYDVAPDLSAVRRLVGAGIDTWVVDFGAPETEEGGMERTLDDHVRAVAHAVDRVRRATGRNVHLGGYSQGGMFVYQAAAYRRSAGIASLITFGSPVDIHKNLPSLSADLTGRILRILRPVVEVPLQHIEGLPGVLTSTGFKVLSLRKEVEQLVDFVRKLHDRQALEKRESRRRFLAGEGFVAWPGPALRKFVDEFIVQNRMMSGGFVINGRTVTLADITTPVLYFVGGRDDIARPASVRAIEHAVPTAELFEATVPAGHFGLVVGSTAGRDTWPTVIEWIKWREGHGKKPRLLTEEEQPARGEVEVEDAAFDEPLDFDLFYDVAVGTLETAWEKFGHVFEDIGDAVDNLRYQLPRLTLLNRIEDDTTVSFGNALSSQARSIPDQTFFLWKGRAFSYADADRRVENVVRGLIHCGVRPGHHVGVMMRGRPSYLSMVTAINRIGAVSVLLSPEADDEALDRALGLDRLEFLATDPEDAARARAAFAGEVLVLGGGGPNRALPDGVVDMEAIDPEAVELPGWYRPNPGRASDLAMLIVTVDRGGRGRAAGITNRRWAFSAYGAAAACTLTSKDTVYACLPLHHPAGLLVSVGGALVGGTRLALATRFEPDVFWNDVRRYGASVVFYAGEMCRQLVDATPSPAERDSPLRLFAGSGMRADVWRRVIERFGPVGVLEFYASTEVNLVLANASGKKVGAVGRSLPGSIDKTLVEYDFNAGDFSRDALGRFVRCRADQPGVLVAKLDPLHLPEGDSTDGARSRIRRDVFDTGDAWFVTGDFMRRDADGDYWFVDRLRDVVRTPGGPVFPRALEDRLLELPDVELAAAYGVTPEGAAGEVIAAAVVPADGESLDLERLSRHLASEQGHVRPRLLRLVERMPMTDGYRPIKARLREEGVRADGQTFWLDGEQYRPLEDGNRDEALRRVTP